MTSQFRLHLIVFRSFTPFSLVYGLCAAKNMKEEDRPVPMYLDGIMVILA